MEDFSNHLQVTLLAENSAPVRGKKLNRRFFYLYVLKKYFFAATIGSAGFDLKANEARFIQPNTVARIKTGLSVRMPEGTFGFVAGRSSLATQNIITHGGIIDPDFTGEVEVLLFNASKENAVVVYKGNRIAQLILIPYVSPPIRIVPRLPATLRGSGGFGSTGL